MLKKAPDFDPRGQWSILDGLQAALWCLVFCEVATEQEATLWVEFFNRMTRNKNKQLEVVKAAWDAASWRLCMDMRENKTFAASTDEIMKDICFFQEIFLVTPGTPPPASRGNRFERNGPPSGEKFIRERVRPWQNAGFTDRSRSSGKGGKEGKGKGKGKPSGKGRDTSRGQKGGGKNNGKNQTICKKFQTDECTFNPCKFLHICETCKKKGHGTSACHSLE